MRVPRFTFSGSCSIAILFAFQALAAFSSLPTWADTHSVLVAAPQDTSLYDLPWEVLNSAQRHKLSLYGLRLAPLDPRVWGLRPVDVTESKILIPIRPFFLRASESTDFRIEEVEIQFRFKKVPPVLMKRHPREHDPVLEIGFGGKYSQPSPGELPEHDSGYAARLSAFPALPSGFQRRERDRYYPLEPCLLPILETCNSPLADL